MPYFSAVCGVSPNCANTGMPARVSAFTASGKSAAASTLTMSAPPSLTRRMAARSALSTPSCTGPKGTSQLTSARVAPRRTALQHTRISSSVTSSGLEWPQRLTPTRVADRDEVRARALRDQRDLVVPGDEADALLAVALHLLSTGMVTALGHGFPRSLDADRLRPHKSGPAGRCKVQEVALPHGRRGR